MEELEGAVVVVDERWKAEMGKMVEGKASAYRETAERVFAGLAGCKRDIGSCELSHQRTS